MPLRLPTHPKDKMHSLSKCPLGLHFNPGLHVCDWPQNVGCIVNVTSTTPGAQELEDSNENTEINENIETTTSA
uniref:Chitin-binding type-2 domain-containing protein n=1 Tax=Timema genevievae TaxID=629358 RepID=A0A7R9JUB8_TIMGE|nr:unnamed protein product [Timema genevievae]